MLGGTKGVGNRRVPVQQQPVAINAFKNPNFTSFGQQAKQQSPTQQLSFEDLISLFTAIAQQRKMQKQKNKKASNGNRYGSRSSGYDALLAQLMMQQALAQQANRAGINRAGGNNFGGPGGAARTGGNSCPPGQQNGFAQRPTAQPFKTGQPGAPAATSKGQPVPGTLGANGVPEKAVQGSGQPGVPGAATAKTPDAYRTAYQNWVNANNAFQKVDAEYGQAIRDIQDAKDKGQDTTELRRKFEEIKQRFNAAGDRVDAAKGALDQRHGALNPTQKTDELKAATDEWKAARAEFKPLNAAYIAAKKELAADPNNPDLQKKVQDLKQPFDVARAKSDVAEKRMTTLEDAIKNDERLQEFKRLREAGRISTPGETEVQGEGNRVGSLIDTGDGTDSLTSNTGNGGVEEKISDTSGDSTLVDASSEMKMPETSGGSSDFV